MLSESGPGTGPLRAALEAEGTTLSSLTVLSSQHDPFRVDTPAGHRDGAWLAATAAELGLGTRRIHLRGLHYMAIGHPKPDGLPYTNTDEDWLWLQGDCAKAARFLGYLPFDQIVDNRNAPPEVYPYAWQERPRATYSGGIDATLPPVEPADVGVTQFHAQQAYRLVLIGEKSSLGPVLGQVASSHEADLYLPTGEMSDTLIYRIARDAADDPRPLVVLYFADCDPSGWQMSISVARKLQAFRILLKESFDFQLHRVALTPAQVREYGLPVTPLKRHPDTGEPKDKRAVAWTAATGIEQTEIDALAALRPQLLRQIARDAVEPFYDRGLDARVRTARRDWLTTARGALDQSGLRADLDQAADDAAAELNDMRQRITELNNRLWFDVGTLDLPPIDIPQAEPPDDDAPEPLIDSAWPFAHQCHALKDSKRYAEPTERPAP